MPTYYLSYDASSDERTYTTHAYVDGSLASIDVSIAWLNANKQAAGSYISGSELTARDVSIDWLNTNKQPLGPYIKDTCLGYGISWVNGAMDVSMTAVTNSRLADLSDVSVNNYTNFQTLLYEASSAKWKNNSTASALTYFYTKAEIDIKLDAIVGGTY